MFESDYDVDLALKAIESRFSYARSILNINTGEIKLVTCKQEISKVDDDTINIKTAFENEIVDSTNISADIFIKAVQMADTENERPDNEEFISTMSNILIKSFKNKYNDSHTTLRDIISNSNIVILDADKKPLGAINKNNDFVDCSDIVYTNDDIDEENNQRENKNINFFINISHLSKRKDFYSLKDFSEIEQKLNSKFYLNFYYQKYPDRVYSVLMNPNENRGITVNKFDIITDKKTVEIYNNNFNNVKNLVLSLSDFSRNSTKKFSLFV